MSGRITIRRILFIAGWLAIGSGMLVLLAAAMRQKSKGLCQGYHIRIQGAEQHRFIGEPEVEQWLREQLRGPLTGKPLAAFSLHELEEGLERNPWISRAQLYFDNRDWLHVQVVEKEPVARVFDQAGKSFYIDSLGQRLPLSDQLSARVPVFTGFPARRQWTEADSLLLQELRETALFVYRDSFWSAQVAQFDIREDGTLEMIPLVGSHVVRLGRGTEAAAKFRRLMVFYRQVLSRTGMDRYKLIDVQYRGQVVASRRYAAAGLDSVQLRRTIDKLLKPVVTDTVARVLPPRARLEDDGRDELPAALPAEGSSVRKDSAAKQAANRKDGDAPSRKPRALMPPPAPAEQTEYQ
jgi:cell division protein FtsQ